MASLHGLLHSLCAAVQQVTAGLPSVDGGTLVVNAATEFPSVRALQEGIQQGAVLVALFDRKLSRNTTRWSPVILSQDVTQTSLVSVLSSGTIDAQGHTATVTLSGTLQAGDAVSLLIDDRQAPLSATPPSVGGGGEVWTPTWGTVALYQTGDALSNLANRLAVQINQDGILGGEVRAAVGGAVVTITSTLPRALRLFSYTGNGGTQTIELSRRLRELQVVLWASKTEDRDTVGDAIETMLAQNESYVYPFNQGLSLSDGSFARIEVVNDFMLDDATNYDAYRRDFLLNVDYPITSVDQLYSVLAPITQYQFV